MPSYVLDIELNAEDNASDKLGNVSKSVSNLGKAATGVAIGGVAALGAGMVAAGMHAIDLAGQVEEAGAAMTTQLGLSATKAEEFQGVMRSIYLNNFGDSFDDIGQALATVEQQFGRIGGTQSQEQLQQVTERAFALRDAFGVDVADSVGAAVTLMDEFGVSSEQAFGMITAGYQQGLDASGDFLDSIGEYSNQFAGGGASAGEFFSILQTGMQGGVLGTDKAADAFKEFGIRILDDSKTTKEALDAIGISYETLRQGFADGSITTIDAMQMVIDKIREIEDPVQRNVIGVALFGTQWEDMGEQAVMALDSTETSLEDVEGAVESLDAQYQTASAEWQAVTRQWDSALVEVGTVLRELGVEVIPMVADAMQTYIIPAISSLADVLGRVKEVGFMGAMGEHFQNQVKQIESDPVLNEFYTGPGLFGGRRNTPAPAQPDLAVVNPANINVTVNALDANGAQAGARAGVTEALQARGTGPY